MQTPQVSNPATLPAAGKQGAKPAQSEGADSFDQALSREVADRGAADAASKEPAAPGQNVRGKPAEAKPAAKAKSADDEAGSDQAAAPADAQSQFSIDMLALVAAINSITAPVARDAGTQTADAGLALAAGTGQADLAGGLQAGDPAGRGRGADLPAPAQAAAYAAPAEAAAMTDAPALALNAVAADSGKSVEAAPEFLAALQESASGIAAAAPANPQLALQAAQQTAAAAAEKLTPPVGTPAWDQALGQKVVWMVAGDQQSASLTLNPPDLGPLQVVLNVSNAQATATFTAAQPEVRQALEAALPKLRDMLGEAGIQLGQASVNSGHPNQAGDDRRQAGQARNGGRAQAADGDDAGAARVSRVQPAAGGLGLVDTFA